MVFEEINCGNGGWDRGEDHANRVSSSIMCGLVEELTLLIALSAQANENHVLSRFEREFGVVTKLLQLILRQKSNFFLDVPFDAPN